MKRVLEILDWLEWALKVGAVVILARVVWRYWDKIW